MDDDLELGQYHKHNTSGNEVRITDLYVLTKDDSDSGWSRGVAFQQSDDTSVPPTTYVRKRNDFLAKYCKTDCPDHEND